ncbi:MAG TPA: peptidylprolyl isomerase [Candidatus Gracilibacteria bacterium]|nr:peptidylprolyl isomerase [Candidatus Gracilibacteria bacterium]
MKSKTPHYAIILATIAATVIAGCAAPTETASKLKSNTSATTSNTPTSMKTEEKSLQLAPPVAGDTIAVIETDMGTIKIKLFPEQTPESAKNFQELAKAGKYKSVPFHRVAKDGRGEDFVIQTGDFSEKDGTGGYSYKGVGTTIPNEINEGLKHLYGSVGMARKPQPDTNGSQFYIVTNKNGTPSLNGGYTVFGQVYEGMDVVDKIAAVETDPATDRPLKDILMKSVTVMPYSS